MFFVHSGVSGRPYRVEDFQASLEAAGVLGDTLSVVNKSPVATDDEEGRGEGEALQRQGAQRGRQEMLFIVPEQGGDATKDPVGILSRAGRLRPESSRGLWTSRGCHERRVARVGDPGH